MRHALFFIPSLALFASCTDVTDPDDPTDDNEVITTVELTFTPDGDASSLFTWADPENDGSPTIDPIELTDGVEYSVTVTFLNELEDPAEDITEEVADEADEHQVFFTGTGVQGPATSANASAVVEHAYDDMDAGGLPIGLDNTITTIAAGTGELTLSLRHLPPENGAVVKVAGLAEEVAAGGFAAIGGDNDVQVTFPAEVQ